MQTFLRVLGSILFLFKWQWTKHLVSPGFSFLDIKWRETWPSGCGRRAWDSTSETGLASMTCALLSVSWGWEGELKKDNEGQGVAGFFLLIKMDKLGDHLGRWCLTSFNNLNEKKSPRLVSKNFSFKKVGCQDMINNRRGLIANKNMNKYSTAGLGMLEPHDWLLSTAAGQMWESWRHSSHLGIQLSPTCEFINHPWSLESLSSSRHIFCLSLSGLEEHLPSALSSPPPLLFPSLSLSSTSG